MQFNEQQPIYLQIAEIICQNILSDKWKGEERIPSVRDIAADMEVNPNTAMRAFEYLQGQEIIHNKRGIGYFVSADGKEKTQKMMREEFFSKTLPTFFQTLQLLGISYSELEEHYNNLNK